MIEEFEFLFLEIAKFLFPLFVNEALLFEGLLFLGVDRVELVLPVFDVASLGLF